jgi:hypothetical protein
MLAERVHGVRVKTFLKNERRFRGSSKVVGKVSEMESYEFKEIFRKSKCWLSSTAKGRYAP